MSWLIYFFCFILFIDIYHSDTRAHVNTKRWMGEAGHVLLL